MVIENEKKNDESVIDLCLMSMQNVRDDASSVNGFYVLQCYFLKRTVEDLHTRNDQRTWREPFYDEARVNVYQE